MSIRKQIRDRIVDALKTAEVMGEGQSDRIRDTVSKGDESKNFPLMDVYLGDGNSEVSEGGNTRVDYSNDVDVYIIVKTTAETRIEAIEQSEDFLEAAQHVMCNPRSPILDSTITQIAKSSYNVEKPEGTNEFKAQNIFTLNYRDSFTP